MAACNIALCWTEDSKDAPPQDIAFAETLPAASWILTGRQVTLTYIYIEDVSTSPEGSSANAPLPPTPAEVRETHPLHALCQVPGVLSTPQEKVHG